MTTLSVDKVRDLKPGDANDFPIIVDTIYGGGAVGVVKASGQARPLSGSALDYFGGFALRRCENESPAAAGDKQVKVVRRGIVTLPISGAVITDVGAHVYASDDDTFSFIGTGAVYIGRVVRWAASGYVDVVFDAGVLRDPWEGMVHETKSANYTVDAEDSGKVLWVDTDGVVITLPAVGGINNIVVANAGAYGAVGVTVAPAAADMVEGADITAADNKGVVNTKATANRGDYVEIFDGDSNGWVATKRKGVWPRVA